MEHLNWGLPIALALFLTGFGAGTFLLAVVIELANEKKYQNITKIGALIAPWPVLLGVLLLVLDLGNPLRFWEFILKRGQGLLMFNYNSVMSIGIWLLSIFVCLALLYLFLNFKSQTIPLGDKLRKKIGMIGLPFGMLVIVYTGVLLAATSNSLWNTILLPAIFCVSAISTGIAGMIFILSAKKETKNHQSIFDLEKISKWVVSFQFLIVILFVSIRVFTVPTKLIAGSIFGVILWLGIFLFDLIFPIYFGFRKKPNKFQTSLIIASLAFLGGFLLRYIILIGGQV